MVKREYVPLPRPPDIVTYIELYYQYKFLENKDAGIVIEGLEKIIEGEENPIKKQYLNLYYGTICDVADSLHELEQNYSAKRNEIERWYKKQISEIEGTVPKRKKEVERALSYGIEALVSYYITQALIRFVPEEISKEATGGIMFVSFLALMYSVDTYYRHKKSKIYEKMSKELDKLKNWYTDRKRELFRRGEIRAEIYWKEYIEGKQVKRNTVEYVASKDGTKRSILRCMVENLRSWLQ